MEGELLDYCVAELMVDELSRCEAMVSGWHAILRRRTHAGKPSWEIGMKNINMLKI